MNPGCPMTRRAFLIGGSGITIGASLGLVGRHGLRLGAEPMPSFTGKTVEVPKPALAMPGPFPGRVIEVRRPGTVRPTDTTPDGRLRDYTIDGDGVHSMMARGMCELTGADHPVEAWRRFFEPGDVVGVKVNPVGRKPNRDEGWRQPCGSISSPEVLLEIVAGLKSAGVRAQDIIVYERYADEFRGTKFNGTNCGYEELMRTRPMQGVRWYASSAAYDNDQTELDGLRPGRHKERDPHVVGYDPDVYVNMGFAQGDADPKDDRVFRTHLSLIVTKMVNKIVTIPVLKDHRSAGVTLCIKNLSHGMNNNVARSHLVGVYGEGGGLGRNPNQCNTFIPLAAGQHPIREKAVLHIMDGLVGVYEGGPGNWNRTWGTWRADSLFFSTDPVAMDHVGWDIIDAKRAQEGWPPVASMGSVLTYAPVEMLSARLAIMAASSTPEALAMAAAAGHKGPRGNPLEQLDRRQPEHIILAGTLGMGIFDAREIEHRKVRV
jgi:hypothetical protein